MRKIDLIVVHCSATPPDMDIGAKEIDEWHRKPPQSFRKIGYHYVIRRNGVIEEGRPVFEVGAHASQVNSRSIGICLVGGVKSINGKFVTENNFTPDQLDSLEALLITATEEFKDVEICGHRDIPGVHKDCPSFDVKRWCKDRGIKNI